MASNRSALIIVSSQYNDPELPDLRAPAQGVQALEEVLKDRRIGNFKVETLLNQEHQPLRRAIQRFFDAGRPGDLLLLYLSCHGLKDDDGGLYFAAKDTELQALAATSVEASLVSQRMERSRSERIVLLLDCYYSGAFPGGVVHLGDAEADIEQRLTGRGRAVISASGAMDYSLTKEQDSVFTDALAHGLGTGEADLNEDGHVSIDELYDYVYEQVTVKTPNQRPHKWLVDVEGSLLIARSPREPNRPGPAPPGLLEAMEERLEASLLRFLPRQRWFSGRGRTLQGTRPWFITTLSSDAPVLVEVVVDVTFTDGYPQRYQIPCGLRTGGDADSFAADHEAAAIGWFVWRGQRTLIYDAVYDPNLGPALLRLLARESRFDKLHFELQPLDIGTPAEIQASSSRLLSVDQTNSSLVCDDKFFLKLFRKLHHGVNIELEVPKSLLSVGFMDLPKPLGWISIPGSTLAVLYKYYPGSETGWEIAARSVAEALRVTDRDLSILDGDFAPHARRIGALTADLHIALTDALDTISADAADPREYSRMRDQLHGVAREVDELGPFAADIDELFAAVEEAAPRHGLQRIHGDYHLDQVLHVDGDRWIVIDFEGEPVRSLDERRHLFTPLRDVAGMRRSFDYAAARGLTELSSSDALEERAIEWSSRNRTAFLAGYIDRAAPANLLPEQSELLLLALEMDKAVYEVRYEFRHRPDWLPIPLRAVERLLAEFQAYRRRQSRRIPHPQPDVDTEAATLRVLFLAAQPDELAYLRVDREYRGIHDQLQRSEHRDHVQLELPRLGVRSLDLTQALLEVRPDIVHFAGHGRSDGALCFEDEAGRSRPAEPRALAKLFAHFGYVRCVVMNACYSATQARAIAQRVDYVIGMRSALGDDAAIAFAAGFYQALAARKPIEQAHELGCIQIGLQGAGKLTPTLLRRTKRRPRASSD